MDSASSSASATPPATGGESGKKTLTFPLTAWANRAFLLRRSPQLPPSTPGSACDRRAEKRPEPAFSASWGRDWAVFSAPARQKRLGGPVGGAAGDALTPHDCFPLKKRMRMQDVKQTDQNCDWISTLPDDILIKILSLLTISDAAMTGCVSTRWRHLWKNVDSLILDAHNLRMQEPELSNYLEDLHLWKAEATKFEFTVRFPLTSANVSEVGHWIRFAASACTEKLCLDLDDKDRSICLRGWKFASEPYDFLLSPFSNGRGCRLSELTLSNCGLGTTPENLSCFPCLHSLTLGRVSVTDTYVSNIMVCIKADDLESFEYMGHEVNIEYGYAPFLDILRVYFTKKNECPLDFISAFPKLPKLETLVLQCPAPVQVPRALRHTFRFANLKTIVICLVTSWKGCICSLAYLLQEAPLLEYFGLHGFSKLKEPSELNMTWPADLTFPRLYNIEINGFSGELELMELLYFLLRRAPMLKWLQLKTLAMEPWFVTNEKHKLQDEERCGYAREMTSTHLAPKVPSTVEFSIT
ncbi:hypothetical protein VPH35_107019 [Triticum aestivum]